LGKIDNMTPDPFENTAYELRLATNGKSQVVTRTKLSDFYALGVAIVIFCLFYFGMTWHELLLLRMVQWFFILAYPLLIIIVLIGKFLFKIELDSEIVKRTLGFPSFLKTYRIKTEEIKSVVLLSSKGKRNSTNYEIFIESMNSMERLVSFSDRHNTIDLRKLNHIGDWFSKHINAPFENRLN
jgi:hypothetical protein